MALIDKNIVLPVASKASNCRLGFTGTRLGLRSAQTSTLLKAFRFFMPSVFSHGDCVGADDEANAAIEAWHDIIGTQVIIRPCDMPEQRAWNRPESAIIYPAEPPLERNKKIVMESDVLIACPGGYVEELRSGTWATIRYACDLRPTLIIWPNGKVITIHTKKDLKSI